MYCHVNRNVTGDFSTSHKNRQDNVYGGSCTVQFKLALLCSIIICFSIFLSTKTCFAQEAGTIYIRADGSIDPPTAPISTIGDNVTYLLMGDIVNTSIVIERDNIIFSGVVVDDTIPIVEGTGNGDGIKILERTNVTIENMNIKGTGIAIGPYSSYITIFGNNLTNNYGGIGYTLSIVNAQNNTIYGNNITNNGGGISLYNSRGNSIYGNNIIGNNAWGISIGYYSDNNTIYRNNIENNTFGIGFGSSSNNNVIYLNNFINNTVQAIASDNSQNIWHSLWFHDGDSIGGGNYWGDYNGSSHLGVGTTPYVIDENNTDSHPWAGMINFYSFYGYEITIISNCSIFDLNFEIANQTHSTLVFKTDVPSGSQGFVRICAPNDLIQVFNGSSTIKLDGELAPIEFYSASLTAWDTWIGRYSQGVHLFEITGITAVPEFPTFLIIPLFMIATLLAMMFHKRRILTRAL